MCFARTSPGADIPDWAGNAIRVRGPSGLTLSLGAWLVWASATRVLVAHVVLVVVLFRRHRLTEADALGVPGWGTVTALGAVWTQ